MTICKLVVVFALLLIPFSNLLAEDFSGRYNITSIIISNVSKATKAFFEELPPTVQIKEYNDKRVTLILANRVEEPWDLNSKPVFLTFELDGVPRKFTFSEIDSPVLVTAAKTEAGFDIKFEFEQSPNKGKKLVIDCQFKFSVEKRLLRIKIDLLNDHLLIEAERGSVALDLAGPRHFTGLKRYDSGESAFMTFKNAEKHCNSLKAALPSSADLLSMVVGFGAEARDYYEFSSPEEAPLLGYTRVRSSDRKVKLTVLSTGEVGEETIHDYVYYRSNGLPRRDESFIGSEPPGENEIPKHFFPLVWTLDSTYFLNYQSGEFSNWQMSADNGYFFAVTCVTN